LKRLQPEAQITTTTTLANLLLWFMCNLAISDYYAVFQCSPCEIWTGNVSTSAYSKYV